MGICTVIALIGIAIVLNEIPSDVPQENPANQGDPNRVFFGLTLTFGAPEISAMTGEGLMGIGNLLNSPRIFGAGLSVYNAATTTTATLIANNQRPSLIEEETYLLRAGNNGDPDFWNLRPRDLTSVKNPSEVGLSTFKNPPVTGQNILSNPRASNFKWDTTLKIPTSTLSKNGLISNNTPTNNFFRDPVLDNNHYVIQHPGNLAKMSADEYLNWWNNELAPKLAEWATK